MQLLKVMIDPELKAALKAQADSEQRTIRVVVERALQDYISRAAADHKR